ncbi:MAG: GAF domain-containing protein [Anaerolineales bacterium]
MSQQPSSTFIATPEENTRNIYRNWREGFVTPLLIGSLIFGLLALIPAVGSAKSNFIAIVFIATYLITLLVTFIKLSYKIKIWVFILIIYVLGLSELATHGILGDGLFFFLGVIIFATMMISPRAGITATAVDIVTFIIFGWLMLTKTVMPVNPKAVEAGILDWLSAGGVIIMFGTIIILGFQRLEAEFLDAQKQIDTTLVTLRDERNNLDNKVQSRTYQLKRVNEIGRAVTSILDPNELLAQAVTMIGDEFDCYYTAIYLIDLTQQWAELSEATGDAGKVLRENKHRIDLKGKSAIATAIQTRQVRIALDTGTESVRFDNPLLPYTRSLLIAPLVVGEKILGAVELHSTKEAAFSMQDADTFQNMANQIATAMENSRLFQEAQQSILEMRATQRQYLQGAWSSLIKDQTLEYELGDDETANKGLEVPLTLREQIIGQISMASTDDWTPEQKNLIETIAAQAALALENARLVEESQSIASRERATNEIISKIWSSTTTESILQTAVRELGRTLEAAEVDIELSTRPVDE